MNRLHNLSNTEWLTAQVILVAASFVCSEAWADDALRFNRDIRPILSQNCFRCHGPDAKQRKSDLRLDQENGIRHAFSKGDLDASEAWGRIHSDDPDVRMPPPDSGLKLNPKEVALIGRWIKAGAAWEGHWSFIPPNRPPVPRVPAADIRNPIDTFIRARLETDGVKPVGSADPSTLIRRLSFDISGLPPHAELREIFVNDPSPETYEKVVDQLLASRRFGERMALFWLDLVRYADSVGYHKDSHRECWMFRDYVIKAFNQNKPFNEFVTEQLAGDLLEGSKFEKYAWKIASGFNRMNQTTSEGGAQAKEYLAKYSADRVRNTAAILLGTTMGCSECHDHKYDPFTTKDFYGFAAFFADLQENGVGYPAPTPIPTLAQLGQWQKLESDLAKQRELLKKADGQAESKDSSPDAIRTKIKQLEDEIRKLSDEKAWSKTLITVSGKPRTIRMLPRGNWLDDSGPVMDPAVPAFLGSLEVGDRRATRLDLAKWVVSRDNPLTARVFVNRVWRLFFGEGISRSLDDLGSQGEWPSHPELLDWLSVEFIESGWDVKRLVKLIVMSRTYQQSSVCPDALWQRDPENRLFARQASFRLPAEHVRDNALAIAGLLSAKMYGRSVKPYQPGNYWYRLYKDAEYKQDHGEDLYRRGVYTYWRRSFWHPSLRAFDAPAREECVAQRPLSNTPAQSLVLLNDPTYVEAARVLATRMIREAGATTEQRIHWVFRRAVVRAPTENETETLSKLYGQQLKRYKSDVESAKKLIAVGETPVPKDIAASELAAWTSVARAILNLHETITRN